MPTMWNYICSKVTGDEGSAPQIRRLYVLKIIITTIIGLVLLATLVVQMVKILTKYSEGPTYISTIIDHKKKAKFPAITICPNNVMYNTSRLKEHGFESAKDYNDARNGRLISWTSNTTLSPWDLFNYITMSSEEIIDSIILDVSHIRDGEGDSIVLNGSDSSLNAKGHRKFGRCWTFYPEENFRTRGINSVKMNFKADVKLYIHRNHQFLDLSGRMGYKVNLGEGHETQINYQDMKMLEKENNEEGNFYCKRILYDECMYGAVTQIMLQEAGCVAPWVMDSTQKICDDFPNINKTFWIAWNRITNQEKDCPNPCDFFLINIGDKNFLRLENPNISYSSYYFASKVTLNEEHYLYSGLVLFAEIGGYTGLLLGLSFLNLSEIIAKLFQRKIDQYNREYQEFVFIQESQQKSRIA